MGGFEALRTVTMPIGAAINQYRFVVVNASGQVAEATIGADAVGVSLEGATAQEFADGKTEIPIALITAGGKCRVKAGAAAISVGDDVASGTAGVAITSAAADIALGKALEASQAATQELITVLLGKNGRAT